jgi:hypothetical protein
MAEGIPHGCKDVLDAPKIAVVTLESPFVRNAGGYGCYAVFSCNGFPSRSQN